MLDQQLLFELQSECFGFLLIGGEVNDNFLHGRQLDVYSSNHLIDPDFQFLRIKRLYHVIIGPIPET